MEALIASIAALETVLHQHQDDRSAGSAVEEIGYHLGEMEPDERYEFDAAIERVAVKLDEASTSPCPAPCRPGRRAARPARDRGRPTSRHHGQWQRIQEKW
ncbi:hypothetical protein Apa02nite_080050 [Actinoplanes palleronii]|uniref:Uncharacterized protein n=1 Tax=Actinoplanes palleronii TaxID=113570 RepID=A0ABQ4BMJ1_9ACTN|nr:hypothetical protein Apa02nite_080050 [Actinoplanes palleronii]